MDIYNIVSLKSNLWDKKAQTLYI